MRLMKLRHIADVKNSNVDKIVVEDECPVRLCNYVDVYKNDFIDTDMEFSAGSATLDEIANFALREGDVIITKDSEDRNDIGVPALVRSTAKDLVCGYHLSMLRAKPGVAIGPFLFWALLAKPVREAFSNSAYGITRYGMTLGRMKDVVIPLPDLDTQKAIADFLDSSIARIDQLVEKKQQFMILLKTRQCAHTSHTVTKGMRDEQRNATGLEAVPEAPAHWQILRMASIFQESMEMGKEDLPVLSVSINWGISDRQLSDEDRHRVVNQMEDPSAYKRVRPGDLVYNMMRAWQGAFGVAKVDGLVSPAYVVARPKVPLHPKYFEHLLRTPMCIEEFRRFSKGIADFRQRLYWEHFRQVKIVVPPLDEQIAIAEKLDAEEIRTGRLIEKISVSVERLQEYRVSLISAAVAGQIDVNTVSDKAIGNVSLDWNKAAQAVSPASPNADPSQARRLVAAEIIHDHRNVAYLGRIKVHKIMFLAEAHADINEINGCYRRQAAGPYDGAMIDDVEAGLRQDRFYDAAEDPSSQRGRITFTPLDNAGGHKLKLEAMLGDRMVELRRIIGLVQDFSTENTEAIATLYAVWNDALIDGEQPDDDQIIRGFREEWHEAKQRFTEETLSTWLNWMRRNDLVPHGSGPHTISAHQPSLF
ncbi:restriction endonuclease subunit S [uncultured Tateyamaria sp.]|uniref:restriction endonuclease subunit S n=1 Tax=uncultured Tateyamaria sp. TaxID=455651 RepID=UPI00262D85AA|nr:restriction endonuclease subunit S [uncultured Tateyamaria sp.]